MGNPTEIAGQLKSELTWFGHATVMLEDDSTGQRVYYVDPFDFRGRPAKKADIVLITHAHFDHCSRQDLAKIATPETKIFAPKGCSQELGMNTETVEPNKSYSHNGFMFRTVPAYNIHPSRLSFHPKTNNWVGYIIHANRKTIYHAGDTDHIQEMNNLGKLDAAMLPIGGTYTMDIQEAISAANAIRAEVSIPIHYRRLLGDSSQEAEKRFIAGVKGKAVILDELQ
ncbi:MBL fold metallo-hydrolase [Candidatus Woesearchaeota archaeon]|nr:MBL fold metallo-hydrolase [Candidatus Woesearchaeota archaeon]